MNVRCSELKKGDATRVKSRSGFTLIELMVVIAILAILAGVIGPRLIGALGEGRATGAKTQIKNFETALMAYKIKFGKFPTSSEGLQALMSNAKGVKFLDGDQVPDDPWQNPYHYTCPGSSGHDYEIVSYGDDNQPGGTGEDADIKSWDLNSKE